MSKDIWPLTIDVSVIAAGILDSIDQNLNYLMVCNSKSINEFSEE